MSVAPTVALVSPQKTLPDGNSRPSSPTVLIVEDHEDTRDLLRYVLERTGRTVLEAVDGDEAVRLAAQFQPQLILMDAGLPGCDGLSATKRIRELAAMRDVPIVFLSGHVQPELRAAALEIGGNEYLSKPVSLDDLELVVSKYLMLDPSNTSRPFVAQRNREMETK